MLKFNQTSNNYQDVVKWMIYIRCFCMVQSPISVVTRHNTMASKAEYFKEHYKIKGYVYAVPLPDAVVNVLTDLYYKSTLIVSNVCDTRSMPSTLTVGHLSSEKLRLEKIKPDLSQVLRDQLVERGVILGDYVSDSCLFPSIMASSSFIRFGEDLARAIADECKVTSLAVKAYLAHAASCLEVDATITIDEVNWIAKMGGEWTKSIVFGDGNENHNK